MLDSKSMLPYKYMHAHKDIHVMNWLSVSPSAGIFAVININHANEKQDYRNAVRRNQLRRYLPSQSCQAGMQITATR